MQSHHWRRGLSTQPNGRPTIRVCSRLSCLASRLRRTCGRYRVTTPPSADVRLLASKLRAEDVVPGVGHFPDRFQQVFELLVV